MHVCGITIPLRLFIKEIVTPVSPEQYWFVTTYIVFYLTIPFVQKFILSISMDTLRNYCIIMWLFVPIYNFFYKNVGGDLAYFYTIYITTYYLKHDEYLYKVVKKNAKKMLSTLVAVNILGVEILCYLGSKLNASFFTIVNKFIECDNIMVFFMAFCIMSIVLEMQYFESDLINFVAKASLGTYIITENYLVKGDLGASIWDYAFGIYRAYEKLDFVNYSIQIMLTAMIVYGVCITYEAIVKRIEDLAFNKCNFINDICTKIDLFLHQ